MSSPLARYFTRHRKDRGAQAELAKRVGVSEATMSRYVTGGRRPGPRLALDIEAATDGKVRASAWPHLRPLLARLSSRSA